MVRKIKIVHLVNELKFDGSSKVVLSLCKLFHTKQYEITIVSLTQSIELTKSDEWPIGISIYSFNYVYDKDYSLRRYIKLYCNQKITSEKARDIIACLNEIQPDIIHCHLQPRELLIPLLIHSKHTTLLLTDHLVRLKKNQYPYLNTLLLNWIYKKIYRKFHVVAVANSVFQCHQKFGLISRKKIHALIENRIDTDMFTPIYESKDILHVIYIARLEPRKGQELLIKAWAKISSVQKTELLIVGTGNTESSLKHLCEQLNPRHPVIFTGSIKNVVPLLQSSSIAVFPSFHEGLPLALLEKMACGLPVIASDIDEFKGIISDGENGIIFKTGDVEDLATKLSLVLDDKLLRDRLGKAARHFVVERYSIRNLLSAYESVYKKILIAEND